MIRLFTGQPGHGKTQRAIGEGLKFLAEGRVVYVGNIKELDYEKSGFLPLESFKDWESLPDGSVVIWDECYDAIGTRGSSAKVPAHVEALARHRHRGFDFILVAQQSKQLDGFVSGLIEQHWHFRRKFGTSVVIIKKWDQWQRDAQKATALVSETWRLDSKLWQYYKSATMHTVKKHVPWYYFAAPLVVLAVIAAALYLPKRLLARAGAEREELIASDQRSAGQGLGVLDRSQSQLATLRQKDPLALLRPRVEGSPWTAPAYDDLPLGRPPQLACIQSADRCFCLTADQGTRYNVSRVMCMHIVRFGRYDPTRTQQQQQPERKLQPPGNSIRG